MLTTAKRSPATHRLTDVADTMTDALSDVWSSSTHLAKDLAATAVERASELGSAAAEQVTDASHRVVELADRTRDKTLERVRPRPARRKAPWMLVAAAVGLGVLAIWWTRRRDDGAAVDTEAPQNTATVQDLRAAAAR